MTHTLALTGKSGSGKTTLTKVFCEIIKEKFPDYDPNLDEFGNMKKFKYYKIWNCGYLKYAYDIN